MSIGRIHHSPIPSGGSNRSSSLLVVDAISSYSDLWKDIKRDNTLLDGEHTLATIAYTPEARRCLLLFTATVAKGEVSDRVFNLTAEVIQTNSANYTAWHYRRLCLTKLNKNLVTELEFVRQWAEESEKNYQVWHHRRWLLSKLGSDFNDKAKAAEALYSDGKNYAAWSHRQWLVKEFGLWDGEMEFVNKMIHLDGRNNSAWNYRHFLLCSQPLAYWLAVVDKSDAGALQSSDGRRPFSVVQFELKFALSELKRIPHNECPYRYVQCLLRYAHQTSKDEKLCVCLSVDVSLEQQTSMLDEAMEAIDVVLTAAPNCRHALYTKACVLEYKQSGEDSRQMYDRLCVVDPIRKLWWQWKLAAT
eukprot:GHVS01053372.1.p1 GENE.GHVS01053372.1~~GHVS01053372.1.p1  ORF type:complete len:360 (-),score=52.78 GHVS01053372.1:626-1705(-)